MKVSRWFIAVTLSLLALSAYGAKVHKVTVNGNSVFYISKIPQQFLGRYLYEENNGEPVIELNANNRGYFQAHGEPKFPIQYWLLTDSTGKVIKQENPDTGSYRVTLVLRYGDNPNGNYPSGNYAMWYLTWNAESRCFDILGERRKCSQ